MSHNKLAVCWRYSTQACGDSFGYGLDHNSFIVAASNSSTITSRSYSREAFIFAALTTRTYGPIWLVFGYSSFDPGTISAVRKLSLATFRSALSYFGKSA